MKRLSLMILLFISICFVFVVCGKNDQKQCKDVTKNYTLEMYNQSCDELEKLYFSIDSNDTESIEKTSAKLLF